MHRKNLPIYYSNSKKLIKYFGQAFVLTVQWMPAATIWMALIVYATYSPSEVHKMVEFVKNNPHETAREILKSLFCFIALVAVIWALSNSKKVSATPLASKSE